VPPRQLAKAPRGRCRRSAAEALAWWWLGRRLDGLQVQAGGDGHAAADGPGHRAAVGVQPEHPLDRRPLLLVGDHRLVDHQMVGEVDAPDDQDLAFQLDLTDRVRLETTVSGGNAARLQRAPEGPGQSAGGCGHQVVQGGGVRLVALGVGAVMLDNRCRLARVPRGKAVGAGRRR
jgi:hypothetical protein